MIDSFFPRGRVLRGASWRFALLNIGFWTAIAFLFAVQANARGMTAPFAQIFIESFASFAPCLLLTPPLAILAMRHHFAPGTRPLSTVAHLAGVTAFVIIGGAMMGIFAWLLPWARKGDILAAAQQAVVRYLAVDVLIYVMIAGGVMALVYARESRDQSLAAAKLHGQLAEARLHVLSAQLQPHFLFNTLHAISALVREDPPQAERLLARLSELLRDTLRDNTKPETSVEHEFSFLEKYVEVQEARFGPRLQVRFAVDPRVIDARVPRLILQPLVENAIRHGIAPRPGPGVVEVVAEKEGDELTLFVRDDGVGVTPTFREGIGLRTTRERLQQMYGSTQQFSLANQPQGGAVCAVRLPLRKYANGASGP